MVFADKKHHFQSWIIGEFFLRVKVGTAPDPPGLLKNPLPLLIKWKFDGGFRLVLKQDIECLRLGFLLSVCIQVRKT